MSHLGRASGDPHPGNYLLLEDGRVGFLDFGLMRDGRRAYLDGEQAIARAVVAGDAAAVHRGMAALGYLPDPAAFSGERLLAQLRLGGEWYFEPGVAAHHARLRERPDGARLLSALGVLRRPAPDDAPASGTADPPHGGPGVLHPRRAAARADWAALGAEYYAGEPPATPLGALDAEFWGARRPALRAAA